jgi:4-amino-4-deoxy-L-arabinose transferase-like glycosyltransferase
MNDRLKYSLLFAALGALFFIPFLGGVHLFDWDEINFAEISREMMLMEEYTRIYINFQPFWEKPPLFFWNQAAAMYFFGVNEFSARLPNALIGIATLVLLFNIGKQLYSTRFGIIWAGVYFGSILPFLYFKSGIIDPYFNFFIFLGIYLFILFYWKKDKFEHIQLKRSSLTYLFAAGFFIGVGILTKGQVAYLIACLTFFVYWVYQRFRFYVNVPQFLFFTLSSHPGNAGLVRPGNLEERPLVYQ